MGRVLVVSHNPGIAMGLSATDHDVVDIRPAALEDWVDRSRGERLDGVVLDVTDAESALRAITELRSNAQMAPVLVVPGDGVGWDDARMRELPAAAMLPRPVTKPSLQDAVDRLVAHGTDSLLMSPVSPVSPASSDEDGGVDGIVEGFEGHLNGDVADALAQPAADDDRAVSTLIGRLTATPSVAHPPVEPLAAPTALVEPPTVAEAPARSRLRPMPSSRPAVPSSDALMGPAPRQPRAIELVRSLLAVTDNLYGVRETAQAVVVDALERTGAEAAAVMLPDGERWRVVAGIGLRALEHRYELTSHDWLVVEVAQGNRSVLMEDTDLVRQPLRGSPLASWHHLVATPIPVVSGVLLVARAQDPAFTQGDVESLAALTAEASPLVVAALDVRTLARRLDHLRDQAGTGMPQA